MSIKDEINEIIKLSDNEKFMVSYGNGYITISTIDNNFKNNKPIAMLFDSDDGRVEYVDADFKVWLDENNCWIEYNDDYIVLVKN